MSQSDKTTTDSQKVGEFVRIDKLHPHHKNPRNNDHAVEAIANSIKRFGFTSPIVANKDQTILAGHTRWKAAKSIGLDTVPVVYVDLSPVDAELLMIADNKLGEKADWNMDQLSDLLTGLRDKGEDLEILGFEDHELDDLLDNLDDDPDPFGDGEAGADQEFDEVTSDLDFRLLKGNCLDMLKELPDNSIDSIVTDPPYELGFMGKAWDNSGIAYSVELWSECLRVLKHGGHLVAFSGSRTVFPMGVAIAEAGFEVRDMISWIYTSGFPKSMNVSIALDKQLANMPHRGVGVKHAVGQEDLAKPTATKDLPPYVPATKEAAKWLGWGTALKPAQEPAVLARKPIDPDCSSIAENVLKWGTGAINIDAGRFAYGDDCHFGSGHDCSDQWDKPTIGSTQAFVYGEMGQRDLNQKNDISAYKPKGGRWPANVYQCKKPQRSEKEAGLDHLTGKTGAEATQRKEGSDGLKSPRAGAGRTADEVKNFHPTVKPIKLMRWLCRLLTPQGGTVLDPFLGSGTTAVSAILEGFNAVGCEMTEDYYPIIQGRVNWAKAERNKEILNGQKVEAD